MALTNVQAQLLNIVTREPGMTFDGIRIRMGVKKSQAGISRSLNILVRKGLLERRLEQNRYVWYPAT